MDDNKPVQSPRPVEAKNKTNKVLVVLLVLVLIACAVLGWFAYSNAQAADERSAELDKSKQEVNKLKNDVMTMQSDMQAKEAADKAKNTTTDETEAVITAAKEYASKDQPAANATFEVDKIEGDFARVKVMSQTTGYQMVLKKVDGTWKVLIAGNGQTPGDQAIIDRYQIPKSML